MSDPRLTAQIHVIAMRGPAHQYATKMVEAAPVQPAGSPYLSPSKPPAWLKEHRNARAVASPWKYILHQGHVTIQYPEGWELTEKMMGQLCDDAGSTSEYMTDPYHHYAKTAHKPERDVPRAQVLSLSRTRVLTITSKMGAMSFNLPAGPTRLLGTCPGSIPGWRTKDLPVNAALESASMINNPKLKRSWDEVTFRSWKHFRPKGDPKAGGREIDHKGEVIASLSLAGGGKAREQGAAALLRRELVKSATDIRELYKLVEFKIDSRETAKPGFSVGKSGKLSLTVNPRSYICNGCYAMKGSYGGFSTIFGMEIKRLWLYWCLKHNPQEFVDVMTLAIAAANVKNARKRERDKSKPPVASDIKLERALATPNPDYFRIHDCGDFVSVHYFRLWLEVMDRFPKIKFWAPTRLWFSAEISAKLGAEAAKQRTSGKSGWPTNLNLRPSALHFGDPAPSAPDLCHQKAGSGSMDPTKFGSGSGCLDAKGKDLAEWMCPAYKPFKEGGGALYQTEGKGKSAKLKLPVVFETSGACQYAQGLNPDGKCASAKHQGCRVCWDHPDVHVVYAEH